MKRSMLFLSVSTILVLSACGNNEEDIDNTNAGNNANDTANESAADAEEADIEDQENMNENNEEAGETQENMNANEEEAADEIAEDGWETEVGETVENEGGTFTLHARQDDINTTETGPIVIEIEQLNTASGELAPDLAEMMEMEEIEYIQMDLQVENTADEDLTFYSSQPTIATNTGEQIEPDMWLSDYIEADLMSGTTHSGSMFFILENSNAEDIESVRVTWSAPMDEDFNDVGEEVDIEIEF